MRAWGFHVDRRVGGASPGFVFFLGVNLPAPPLKLTASTSASPKEKDSLQCSRFSEDEFETLRVPTSMAALASATGDANLPRVGTGDRVACPGYVQAEGRPLVEALGGGQLGHLVQRGHPVPRQLPLVHELQQPAAPGAEPGLARNHRPLPPPRELGSCQLGESKGGGLFPNLPVRREQISEPM